MFYTCVSFCSEGGVCIQGSFPPGGSASRGMGLHPGGSGLHPGGGVCIQEEGSASREEGSASSGCFLQGWVCLQEGGRAVPHRILWDTVNERAVRILLECIIVEYKITVSCMYKIITNAVRFTVLLSQWVIRISQPSCLCKLI